ncbi:uncharacterized protein BCR38DRAFT_421133 [Pseudomassariella vexata]|uniref:Uncharacterized protein n=1 Tax=Pseudomassariella vexata TaxID=1141098 RepID=A0A1Y2EEZ7_9PEZI|nr:uncharacterized protein BCR38DRAFT_421133 [Pseudomassariella vexata]ORY70152.1 hypothetical protein BCR38DRAFT_421133 [Pseudomassariella vexata]
MTFSFLSLQGTFSISMSAPCFLGSYPGTRAQITVPIKPICTLVPSKPAIRTTVTADLAEL